MKALTRGHGPDACIDAVGMEAHEGGWIGRYDKVKQIMRLETDRPFVLRQAIMACRKGGVLSVIGAYAGLADKIPIGAMFNKSLTVRNGQCNVQKYWKGKDAPKAYRTFTEKKDGCIKVVLKP